MQALPISQSGGHFQQSLLSRLQGGHIHQQQQQQQHQASDPLQDPIVDLLSSIQSGPGHAPGSGNLAPIGSHVNSGFPHHGQSSMHQHQQPRFSSHMVGSYLSSEYKLLASKM